METPQPDKTGVHILLKLASLVVILAGIHAAADIIVQLLLALFLPSSSTRSVPRYWTEKSIAPLPLRLWWW